jgi:hypothetical protein
MSALHGKTPQTMGEIMGKNPALAQPVLMEKPRMREEWDKVNSSFKWHFKCKSVRHLGAIKTGFSKRIGSPEFPKGRPDYDHIRLLMDKIGMLQNNHYFFEKASRIDFFIRVYDETRDSFMWECFLTCNPASYYVWQPAILNVEKWKPLRDWLKEFYHSDYTQRYVTRESFFMGRETQYTEKFRGKPLSDAEKARLSKHTVDELLDPANLTGLLDFKNEDEDFENLCRFLNYLTFQRKAAPSQVAHFLERARERYPRLKFEPLQPTRY